MSRSGPKDKSFDISKQLVWEAYRQVRANKGAPGVDEQSLAEFEKDLKNNLYKIWNRLSAGTYFPPPVRAVEIAKPQGRLVRSGLVCQVEGVVRWARTRLLVAGGPSELPLGFRASLTSAVMAGWPADMRRAADDRS